MVTRSWAVVGGAALGLRESATILTALALNSLSNFRLFSGIASLHSRCLHGPGGTLCVIHLPYWQVEGFVQSAGTFGGRCRAILLVAAVPLQCASERVTLLR